jgi:hypothetical protein
VSILSRKDYLPGAPVYTATLKLEPFLEMSKYAVIPQDPGAYKGHGPYSHRIQWFVIFFYYKKKRLSTPPKVLLEKMPSEAMKPPEKAWPKLESLEGLKQTPEGSGTMWDALLDRQHADKEYVYAEDGITHPEMLTAALTGKRDTSDANKKLMQVAPNVAKIVTAAYDLFITTDTVDSHRDWAIKAGYVEYAKDVYVRKK